MKLHKRAQKMFLCNFALGLGTAPEAASWQLSLRTSQSLVNPLYSPSSPSASRQLISLKMVRISPKAAHESPT